MVCHVVRVPVILLGVTGMDNLSDAQIFHDLLGLNYCHTGCLASLRTTMKPMISFIGQPRCLAHAWGDKPRGLARDGDRWVVEDG